MANESAHVYKEYENALNATKIQVKQMSADGSSNFIDATYQNLLDSDYLSNSQVQMKFGVKMVNIQKQNTKLI